MIKRKWYAVYTKSRWEIKVAEGLRKRKIEHYCPVKKEVRQWSDRRKTITKALFTSYVFVHATPAEQLTIKQTPGVISLVHWLGQPAVIRSEEIVAIQRFLHDQENVVLEKITVNVADRVRIIDSALSPYEATVLEVRTKTVKLLLPSLGYALTAEVSKNKLERLPQARIQE